MARLPIQGGDNGVWGTVLNDFLLVEHNPDGTLRADGSLAAKANNSAVVHLTGTETVTGAKNFTGGLQSGGSAVAVDSAVVHISGTETVTGNKNFTGTLQHNGSAVVDTTDVRLTNQYGYYPPEAYGLFVLSQDPRVCDGVGTISGGFIARMFVPAGQAINTVSACVYSAGVVGGGGNNGFAIYDDDGVLVDSLLSESIWTSTGWLSGDLTAPIAAQSSGRFVYVAAMCNGYDTSPQIYYSVRTGSTVVGGLGMSASKRHSIFNISMSSFPASFDPTSYGALNTYMPIIGLA